MNVIINGFMHEKQEEILHFFENHPSVKKCCIISDRNYITQKTNTDLFIVQDIINGNYPIQEYLTPSQIRFINENFFILMEMMNRFYVYLHKEYGYEQKKKIIYNHFSFWMDYIKKNEITHYISSNVPHDVYDEIILLSMKYYKQDKILFFLQSQFRDMIIPMKNVEEQNPQINSYYLKEINNKVILSKLSEIEWNAEINAEIPFYMKKNSKYSIFIKKLKKIKKISSRKLFLNIKYWQDNKKLENEYNKLAITPDLSNNYIYFPLHYQPEMTSCILGTLFVNQYLIIKLLDSLLPSNWFLYVKEHPKQEFCNRYLGYYNDLNKSTRRTIFVKKSFPSAKLINNCKSVVTISGTAGWEALFQKKTVLLFGNNFYQSGPGVYQIKNMETLIDSINKIINKDFIYNENNLKAFLNSIEKNSIHGFVDSVYCNNSSFSFEESNKNLIEYISNWISQNEN